ncbi:uncharacterized protein [Anabrus simplex]|uniref:uncharacterized protein n=1 Tax=Anabrus simplex TaxID=316456 RepID=UPI0035A39815
MGYERCPWIPIFLWVVVHVATAHREHKVHNIVLYPDKHSWCKTTPIKQVVAYPGCSSIEIDNNVCVGTCFSYSIPRTVPSAPGEVIKPYCDSCQPSAVTWKNLTLDCEGGDPDLREMQKSVQIITNCSCSTCDLGDDAMMTSTFISSGDGDIGHKHSEGQELMDWMLESHNTRGGGKPGMKPFNASAVRSGSLPVGDPAINERLLVLLKQLAGIDEDSNEHRGDGDGLEGENVKNVDKVALKELLKEVEGTDHKVNQATLGELVKQFEEKAHIIVDLDRLRHVLIHLQHEMQKEKSNIERHHADQHRHHQHSHHHSVEQVDGGSNLEPSHHRLPIHAQLPGKAHHLQVADDLDTEKIDPTLDVEPHHLKPALGGGELSYHDNLLPTNDNEDKTKKEEEF